MAKVLVVDDDPVMQLLVRTALRSEYEVAGETSGSQVVEVALVEKPQIILLDLSMPNVDGFEVLAQLKRHPMLSNIPVICMSGMVDEDSRQQAYRAGAAGFIAKPVDIESLARDIEHLLKSLRTELVSSDGKRRVYIERNSQIAGENLRVALRDHLGAGNKALVMSVQAGASFFQTFENDGLKSGHLSFLEIKPALIVRLPYLEDLSPLIADAQALINHDCSTMTLFFEGPEQIVNVLDQDKSAVTIRSFSEIMAQTFSQVRFYSSYTDDQNINRNINGMAKLLARVG